MLNSSEIQSLNELEMSVYNYVTAHQEEVAHIKIRDLANAAYVSTSTVLRFARKWDVTAFQNSRFILSSIRRAYSFRRAVMMAVRFGIFSNEMILQSFRHRSRRWQMFSKCKGGDFCWHRKFRHDCAVCGPVFCKFRKIQRVYRRPL